MRQESVEYIEQLLQDKNLIQVQVHLNHEDNEFSCDVFCEAPEMLRKKRTILWNKADMDIRQIVYLSIVFLVPS